ncbi:RDD family protein [Aerococcus sanguinicola]|nr:MULTISPECIES: RDD family protein [unclassified Aerococcus]MDK6233587.1 RDD family protein [Aerococcus sp. UMB10185]MDK6856144.1 RDD family protein [Aerococcus sp. UMB7533]MDK8501483.1 RDD family protein [Aerococcus sp. UMB1112A]OFN01376.1 hypothetical protein HMPREF2626_07530 [Aerococcus sp. HMSC062A02]OHO46323.1 hypothetical protein HMPREF2705_09095 [Aerococcus sp. HMSC035B07]
MAKERDDKLQGPLPQLNDQLYHGRLEGEAEAVRHDKQKKAQKLSGQDLLMSYRRHVDRNLVNGFSRKLYAGFWIRLWAFLVDLIFVGALQAILLACVLTFLPDAYLVQWPLVKYLAWQLVLVVYFSLASYLLNGQTLGKALFKLQVVKADQYRLNFGTCFVREGLGKLILSNLPILGLFVVVTPKRQNFMDFFTDTNVVALDQFRFLYEENRI